MLRAFLQFDKKKRSDTIKTPTNLHQQNPEKLLSPDNIRLLPVKHKASLSQGCVKTETIIGQTPP